MLKIPEMILRNCTHKSLDYNKWKAQPELQINNYTGNKLLILAKFEFAQKKRRCLFQVIGELCGKPSIEYGRRLKIC